MPIDGGSSSALTRQFKEGASTAAPAAAADRRSNRRLVSAEDRGQTTPRSREASAKDFFTAANKGVRDMAMT
jgi:hypothetical protein